MVRVFKRADDARSPDPCSSANVTVIGRWWIGECPDGGVVRTSVTRRQTTMFIACHVDSDKLQLSLYVLYICLNQYSDPMKDPPPRTSHPVDGLIPAHGGYRKLQSFQVTQLCFDVTVRFCDRYVDKRDRTHDQMVQAARSGKQNIAEGSKASGTSRKTELKLTNVARASLEELRLDYEDYLRKRGLEQWS